MSTELSVLTFIQQSRMQPCQMDLFSFPDAKPHQVIEMACVRVSQLFCYPNHADNSNWLCILPVSHDFQSCQLNFRPVLASGGRLVILGSSIKMAWTKAGCLCPMWVTGRRGSQSCFHIHVLLQTGTSFLNMVTWCIISPICVHSHPLSCFLNMLNRSPVSVHSHPFSYFPC